MAPTTDIPVTITEEATQHAAELGLQKEFEQVVRHTLETIPGVRWLDVTLEPGYGYDIPCILLRAFVSDFEAARKPRDEWGLWRLTDLTPQVGQHFVLFILPEETHAG
jgi:hypothetical protein